VLDWEKHTNARRYWGHPEAKAIRRTDYSCELEDVKEIILKNLDHAGVDPLDLAMEISALWLLHTQSRGLVKSDLHLEYLMGGQLIRFIRCVERTKGPASGLWALCTAECWGSFGYNL